METRCVAPPGAIHEAAELLAAGEVVALPTETVYGLGACALNAIACAKVFEAKERPLNDPLIVHLPSGDWLDRVARPSPLARTLADRFWPGPFTMVLPRCAIIPDIVTDGQETVAVRISAHPVFQEVALALDQPIAAPSANRFGRISPTEPAHVLAELGGRIPLVVDGGRCAHGLESTIVYVHEQGVEILRHGPITRELLQESVPVLSGGADAVTPGSMKSHYAPRTPLVLGLPPAEPPADLRAGLLAFSRSRPEFVAQEVLSPTGDLREAAANLYGAMRRLDDAGLEVIYAEAIPESGLGAALMERLRKAAVRD